MGGSIWGRFGFSDVLTLFLALDTRVLLYRAGEMSLWEFAGMKKDNDILTGLTVRKRPQKTAYLAYRNTKTDFPVLTCAMALPARKDVGDFQGMAAVGATARKSDLPGTAGELPGRPYRGALRGEEALSELTGQAAREMAKLVPTGSNLRAGAEYRSHLARVLLKRNLEQLLGAEKGGAL